MAAGRAFELLLVLSLISGCSGINPCTDYKQVWMEYGRRSSDFNSRYTDTSICDSVLDPRTWYRFEHDAGNRLIEGPVEPWYCGTQAPIWLNGSHPTDTTEVTAEVCSTYSSTRICGWNGTVQIQMCNETGSEYFVYLLAVPSGCPLAYCVDAATRKQCVPPDVWLPYDFKCGQEVKTTPAPPTSSSPTEAPGPGWSTWGPWSDCSKPCDYGKQTRRRTCGELPCTGDATGEQLCAQFNCEESPAEKDEGAVLNLLSADSAKDTMLTVVSNQLTINTILMRNINSICSLNASLCCGFNIESVSSDSTEFVTSDDIYSAKGSPKQNSDGTVQYKVIAVIDDDVNKAICAKKTSSHLITRQVQATDPSFIPVEAMAMAARNSASDIRQETGLAVTANLQPFASSASCPLTTCVVPIIVVVIIIAAAGIGLGAGCYMHHKTKKSKTTPDPNKPEKDEIRPTSARMIIPVVNSVKTEKGSQQEEKTS